MPVIAGNRLWRIMRVTVPADSTLAVAHGLQAQNAVGIQPNEILIIPVPVIPAFPGWEGISIGTITTTTIEFINTTSGEAGVEITINVLLIMPHTIIGPGDNNGYV